MSKIIAVVGATGSQGGGLVEALLKNGKFSVRGLTRNPNSDKAKAMAEKGVQMVQAELDDVESLKKAFEGAHGAYFVTNFWEHFNVEKEMQQIRNLADAAKAAGVKHVVNSTFDDSRSVFSKQANPPPKLANDMFVPPADGKGGMAAYVSSNVPSTQLYTSFYMENFLNGMGPSADESGNLSVNFNMEDKPLPMISVKDIGRAAAKIFEDEALIGKDVYVCNGETVNGQDIAKTFSQVLGKPVTYNAVPFDIFRKLEFPGAAVMANLFRLKHESPTYTKNRLNDPYTSKLVPDYVSLESFIEANKAVFTS